MDWLSKVVFTALIFILGAGVGSFIGLIIYRIKNKKSIFDRSVCEKCGKKLSGFELIPVLGWLFLKGKCRKCHKKIDKYIPLIEMVTATFFTISFWFWPWSEQIGYLEIIKLALWLLILAGLITLLFFDLRYKKLPNKIMLPTMAFTAIFYVFTSVIIEQNSYSTSIYQLALAMLPIAGVYGLIYLISRGKLVGFGDVKLGIVIGFLLTWQNGVIVLFSANILAFIIVLPLLLLGKVKTNQQISFGQYLILATIVVFYLSTIIGFF